jgi:hypothetical protein
MTSNLRRATAIMMTCAMSGALSGAVGCSLATSINRNSDAIGKSTAAISSNTDTIAQSTKATGNLVPALQDVGKLQEPMKQVAALDPTMKSVAALSDPMTRVAALEPAMRGLANLQQPMINLVAIKPSLDAAAGLGGPLGRVADMRTSLESVASLRDSLTQVAALDVQLKAVAELRPAMKQLGQLKQPLERVGALGEPLQQLGPVLALLEHPVLLLLAIALGLGAWGAVTFYAVKLAILSAARKTATTAPAIALIAICAMSMSAPAFAQTPPPSSPMDPPHAGDCAITLHVPPTIDKDTIRIALDNRDARVLFKVAQVNPFVVTLSNPLLEGSTVFVTIGSQPTFDIEVAKPVDGTKPPDACVPPEPNPSEYDGRSTFEANAFVGAVFDNFAPAQVDPAHPEQGLIYRNTPDPGINKSWTAGVQAAYRLLGRQDSVRQVWLSTQILHGLRTSDVDCTKSPDLAVCKASATLNDRFFAIIEHASTMEAHIDARVELLRLQVTEDTPVKVYAATRFGFVSLSGAPKVFSSDSYISGGLMAPKGVFRGSFAQIGWGRSRQFQTDPNADRMKIFGTLMWDIAPGLLDQARNIFTQTAGSMRFFAAIVVDRNPGGRAPDSVQSYFGIMFDVRRLYSTF